MLQQRRLLLLCCCPVFVAGLSDTKALAESNKNDHLPWNDSALERIVQNVRRVTLPSPNNSSNSNNDKTPGVRQGIGTNRTLSFPLPCSYTNDSAQSTLFWIQESMSSLLSAKAMAKTAIVPASCTEATATCTSTRRLDELAWEFLDALLLQPQQMNQFSDPWSTYFQYKGLLPKYWYLPMETESSRILNMETSSQTRPLPPYLENTRFPHWSLFSYRTNNHHTLPDTIPIPSSHRLSAIPLHASILWDMVLAVIPPQEDEDTSNTNADTSGYQEKPNHGYSYNYADNKEWWDRVEAYFQRIYQHHAYLHEVVMRGCFTQDGTQPHNTDIPCYNILHPWESLMDPTSPAWQVALQPILQHLETIDWKLPFSIPPQVQKSYDFSPHVYKAMIYLLVEGWNKANLVEACQNTTTSTTSSACAEDALLWSTPTPFCMLDVGYAAILAQADSDLFRLASVLVLVLPENSHRKPSTRQMETLQTWQANNAQLLQQVLWNPKQQTYMSKYYVPSLKEHGNSKGHMEWMTVAVSNNLVAFWNVAATTAGTDDADNPDSRNAGRHKNTGTTKAGSTDPNNDPASKLAALAREHWKDLSMQLLSRNAPYAFDCGRFPIWSLGCHDDDDDDNDERRSNSNQVQESAAMIQPIVNYLVASGLYQSDKMDILSEYLAGQSLALFNDANNYALFGEAFGATSPYPNLATRDICGNTSTATAAIVYNLRVPDPTHANCLPLPPIRRSWVITLITLELFVAFSIGVSCLVVSFSLVHKLKRHSAMEDEWMAAATSGEAYYSSIAAIEEDDTSHDGFLSQEDTDVDERADVEEPDDDKDSPNVTATGGQSFFSSIGVN